MSITVRSASVAPDTRRNIAFGDSITAGYGGVRPWPSLTSPPVTNYAVGGHALWQVQRMLWNTGAYYPAYAQFLDRVGAPFPERVFILAGINDLAAGSSAATCQGFMTDIVEQLESRSIDYRICTVLPTGTVQSYNTHRLNFNAWILSTYPTKSINLEPVMGTGDPVVLNAAYDFGDGVHLNLAGELAMAEAIEGHLA